jgi:hypothetical protein
MSRLLAWLGKNIDGVVALIASAVIVVLDVSSNPSAGTLDGGILLVLGILAVTMLRDRSRKDEAEQEMRDYVRRAAELGPTVEKLQAKVDNVADALNDSAMVRVLSRVEIHQALEEARRDTDRWLFRGGTGMYIRAVTLPGCVASARRDRRALMVRLEIIDPTSDEVCQTYARFRRSLSGNQTEWTTERTRREAYATIIAAAWHRDQYELLDVEVALSRVMPTLRMDLSARSLIITHEGPRPALLVQSGKLLYDYTQTDLRKSFEQARRVPLEQARHLPFSEEPKPAEVVKFFAALDLPLPSSFLDSDIDDIVQRALHAENPYPV